MYIGGTVISSVEFHGNMSLVIFMSKCPLACRYCHNVELLEDNTEWSLDKVKSEIDSSADFLDAVVISGGEPLVQTDAVIEILKHVRKIGLKTKLDTSGIYPEKIQELLDLGLLDYVSLDVKTTFSKYKKITGANVGFKVKKSMELINCDENVHLELRTTYVPTLHTKKDIFNLVDEIEGDVYTIQQFRNKNVLDPALEEVEVPNPHDLRKLAEEIKDNFDGKVKVKSAEFGEQIIKN
ncbi:anaerobic ribonucleoside-triphosphate reductase activating protein [uncultured Methanobrevibacter sp.]|uniref:anaerobic ribonucleoside-triphosphate reductase activating protein n=1 Tax=uncultured Methanobrevibacter sp. TaxID=253161 RepID=UPI0025F190C2|nr:anaerobic ribonucleoside-triphosphate reductase activating protein [uncultured Methanobrevibacter sp.]